MVCIFIILQECLSQLEIREIIYKLVLDCLNSFILLL